MASTEITTVAATSTPSQTRATHEQPSTTNHHHRLLDTLSLAVASQSADRLLEHDLPTSTTNLLAVPAVAATPDLLHKSSMVVGDVL